MIVGCHIGPRNYLNENDELRRTNMELSRQVEQLKQTVALRVAEIKQLEQQQPQPPAAMKGAKIPKVIALQFDRYSNAIDTDGDGADDQVRVYLKTLDQEGRFIPAAGRAVLQAAVIQPGGRAELIGEKTYEPDDFNATYRSGLTGIHYTLELALPSPLPAEIDQVTVKVTFTDAATGTQLTHEMPMRLKSGQP